MRKLSFLFSFVLLILFSITICFGQQGTRSSRRVTTPSPTPTPAVKPTVEDLSIISLADEPATNNTKQTKKTSKTNNQVETESEFLRRTMSDLTVEISSLSERVAQMEEKQQQLIDLEMLSRAETRAETLHQQLFDTLSKEADIQSRLSQIEYESRPEIIERSMSIIGTTRPEDLREARRVQLQAEKKRLQDQLEMIQQNRKRLELATANADQLVERLRNRLEESLNSPVPSKPTRKSNEKQTDTNIPDDKQPQYPELKI